MNLTRVIRFVRHWHARLGVMLAFLFLIIAVTGLALNHTDSLSLAKREIHASWLMRWYGLKPVIPEQAYQFKDGYLVAADSYWVMDGQRLAGVKAAPVGAISWGDLRAVADVQSLYLLMADGRLVDKLFGSALPAGEIVRLGSLKNALVLKTGQGVYISGDALSWQPLAVDDKRLAEVQWSIKSRLSDAAAARLDDVLAPSLPLERIILDVHSGRIFGRYGWLLMDLAALGLVMLSLTGMWIYLRSIQKKRNH
jgi:uncharacterized iron-regulated membrane protein